MTGGVITSEFKTDQLVFCDGGSRGGPGGLDVKSKALLKCLEIN